MVPLFILAHVEAANQLTTLLDGRLTPAAIATGLVIAYALGAIHALSPGHGKTLVGAYLVGSRGTPQAALWLGLTTTVTHTLTVFILGVELDMFWKNFQLYQLLRVNIQDVPNHQS